MKRLALIGAGLTVFGWAYAYRIATHAFQPRNTWLSVVIGDAATDIGASAAIWTLTRNWKAAAAPWVAHALTGMPMIVGQVLKHHFMAAGARAAEAYDNPA